jgi:hypothetical protein
MDDSPQAGELVSANPAAIDSAVQTSLPKLPGVTRSDAIVAVEPRVLWVLRPVPRSIARRITERLMLGLRRRHKHLQPKFRKTENQPSHVNARMSRLGLLLRQDRTTFARFEDYRF